MQTKTGGPANQANLQAGHILFVEGGSDDAFDPTVLKALTGANGLAMLRVHALGSCDDIASAAKAMAYQHQHYYFVVDRDGRSQEFVDHSWANFPNPTTHNLLVWKKRELENYFLEPGYLGLSSRLRRGKCRADLEQDILKEAQTRLYLEAANMVLFHDIRPDLLKITRWWEKPQQSVAKTKTEKERIRSNLTRDGPFVGWRRTSRWMASSSGCFPSPTTLYGDRSRCAWKRLPCLQFRQKHRQAGISNADFR